MIPTYATEIKSGGRDSSLNQKSLGTTISPSISTVKEMSLAIQGMEKETEEKENECNHHM